MKTKEQHKAKRNAIVRIHHLDKPGHDGNNPEADVKALSQQLAPVTRALITEPADADEAEEAVGQRTRLKEIAKDLKDKKDGITKPLNTALKNVRELFRPVEEKLNKAIDDVTAGLVEYDTRVAMELTLKQERIDEQVDKEEISEGKAERIMARATERLGGNVIPTREVREVEVTNEKLVPDCYWTLDMVAVRRDALAGVAIPGVKVVVKNQVYNAH